MSWSAYECKLYAAFVGFIQVSGHDSDNTNQSETYFLFNLRTVIVQEVKFIVMR